MADDQAARDERARRLRQKLDQLASDTPAKATDKKPRKPESPREFTERKAREQDRHCEPPK